MKKAEQKGNTGGLLAKLHYGVCEFLNEAIHILHSATKQCKDISSLTVCLVDLLLSSFLAPLIGSLYANTLIHILDSSVQLYRWMLLTSIA